MKTYKVCVWRKRLREMGREYETAEHMFRLGLTVLVACTGVNICFCPVF